MRTFDLIQETYSTLSANRTRSALTILGIVIGIGSVIAMISIGQGAAKQIENNIQSLGSNLLIVMPGFQRSAGSVVRGGSGSANTLTLEDARAIKEIDGVELIASSVSSREQVKTTTGANTNTSIYGVDENYALIKNLILEQGSFINELNVKKLSKVAILGPTVRNNLFGEGANPIGQKIRLGGNEFSVIGVTESKGGSGFGDSDDLIYIPISTAQRYLTGGGSVSDINIQVSAADLMAPVQEQVNNLLLTRHKIVDAANADFSVISQAEIMNTMTSVTGALTMLLAAIGGISLLVGGIGIMNMMLTTVTERTREIGLRKSLGGRSRDIAAQFLMESATLTFIGGVIGIALGWLSSLLVTKFSGTMTAVTLSSILLAVGVSTAIGLIFGYYPARRAAKLSPIEALRYE